MTWRAIPPLNPQALAAANAAVYDMTDPPGRRLSPTDPADAAARRVWMDAYVAAGGGVEHARVGPSLAGPTECPLEHWVELRYYHCDGSPVPGARYRIEAPGYSASGALDDDGFTHVDGIPPDVHQVAFTFEEDPEDYAPRELAVDTKQPAVRASAQSAFDDVWDWLGGTVQGDFNKDPSISQTAVNAIIGLIPIADQVLDVRDLIAGMKHLIEYYMEDEKERDYPQSLGLSYETWLWIGLFLIAIGLIPTLGSAIKGVLKALITALKRAGRTAGGLSAAQLRRIWEQVIAVLNWFGVRQGNAHRWLRQMADDLPRHLDTAADQIRGAADVLRRFLDQVGTYTQRLRDTWIMDGSRADRILQTVVRVKSALDDLLRKLEDQKRIINEWLGEQLSAILGHRGTSQGAGATKIHPRGPGDADTPANGPNQVVQDAEPPPDFRVRRLASRAHAERALREAEEREIRALKGQSNNARKRYGPAHATVVDRGNVGPDGQPKVYTGRNLGGNFEPTELHPTLQRRRDAYLRDQEAMQGRRTYGENGPPVDGDPGHHAEVQAVNEALWARERAQPPLPTDDAALQEMLVSVKRVDRDAARTGTQFGCCNDCGRILTSNGGSTSVDFTEGQRAANSRPEGQR